MAGHDQPRGPRSSRRRNARSGRLDRDAQALSHRIVDDAVGYLRDVRDRPVWQDMPAEVRAFFETPLAAIARAARRCLSARSPRTVMAYPMGNVHPRFWAWYMGSSNFTGALGDFLAAIQGSNLGGGNHAAALWTSRSSTGARRWSAFPLGQRHAGQRRLDGQHHRPDRGAQRQGGHRRARARRRGHRRSRCASMAPIRFTVAIARRWRRSDSATGRCGAFRPTRSADRPRCAARARSRRIARRDLQPACVIGTAGTGQHRRNRRSASARGSGGRRGSLVPCRRLHRRADRHRARNAHRVAGIERADSVALDPHKWLHAPFEAGCALVRDASAASRRLRGHAGISGDDAARPRIRAMAARLWPADLARFPGAEDLDGAQGARHREVRPPDRPEHRAGPLSRRR